MLNSEKDIITLVKNDKWMMDILNTANTLQLPDWWVCAGFVRSKIWDTLHGFEERTIIDDIDVIYFDPFNVDEMVEKEYEEMLKKRLPNLPWSVKNEARMHLINNLPPYHSSIDAMSKFPETATALGLRINEMSEVVLAAPCGVEDVLNCVIKPTPTFLQTKELIPIFDERVSKKNWNKRWTKVKLVVESY